VRYADWERREGAAVPRKISRFMVQSSVTVRYDLELKAISVEAPTEPAGSLPPQHRADVPGWGDAPSPAAGLEFVPLAPDAWTVEDAAANVRVLVIEREKDLVVLGAPDGDAVSGRFIRGIQDRFDERPIGIVAFGHHHPSPSGGLRAWAAAGATIVAPRGLEEHVRKQLSRPTSLGAPAVTAPVDAKLELFEDRTTIDCGRNTVELLDIKERSDHAFHYVVFHLPGPGVLFEDDLGYFPTTGAARASSRLVGLVDALNEAKIVPKRLVQLWPVRDVAREVQWTTIEELVKAAREKRQGP
jgi:glyoxylase-like metal-dependent hydrolase (beta-lactamase superfamily II)